MAIKCQKENCAPCNSLPARPFTERLFYLCPLCIEKDGRVLLRHCFRATNFKSHLKTHSFNFPAKDNEALLESVFSEERMAAIGRPRGQMILDAAELLPSDQVKVVASRFKHAFNLGGKRRKAADGTPVAISGASEQDDMIGSLRVKYILSEALKPDATYANEKKAAAD